MDESSIAGMGSKEEMFVIVCVQIIVLLMLYNIGRHDRIKNREGIGLSIAFLCIGYNHDVFYVKGVQWGDSRGIMNRNKNQIESANMEDECGEEKEKTICGHRHLYRTGCIFYLLCVLFICHERYYGLCK